VVMHDDVAIALSDTFYPSGVQLKFDSSITKIHL
jgi:hypothetical protein